MATLLERADLARNEQFKTQVRIALLKECTDILQIPVTHASLTVTGSAGGAAEDVRLTNIARRKQWAKRDAANRYIQSIETYSGYLAAMLASDLPDGQIAVNGDATAEPDPKDGTGGGRWVTEQRVRVRTADLVEALMNVDVAYLSYSLPADLVAS